MAQPVNNMPPAPAPSGPHQAKTNAGKGLGIAALVIGIVALVLSWMPIVNNFAAILAVIALVLAIVGLIVAVKKNGTKGLSIAGAIISVVALVVVFASQAFYSAAIDEVSQGIDDAIEQAETGERAASDDEQEAAAGALAVGEAAEVGAYAVTVNQIDLDASDSLADASEYYTAPVGQPVLVDLTATYQGAEEGTVWIDLQVELLGADSKVYSTTTCESALKEDSMGQPGLSQGGTTDYQVCFDVPAEAADGATVRVGDLIDFSGDDNAVWEAQ
ncbi:hypothetical protein [Zhihengliuella salsuginis]|uniref:DUF4352 domain-containing protein n=1 Tax=Zhihengliuella salsuginis TaxID=578222 RepID=A0ABQ3GI53_9MICC|nr:hypothetical protein [Zhihengliuella salsuginis]GHD05321.1 hypothetical protein GCM10008096_14060 [Zhihengliuella salsuginis]